MLIKAPLSCPVLCHPLICTAPQFAVVNPQAVGLYVVSSMVLMALVNYQTTTLAPSNLVSCSCFLTCGNRNQWQGGGVWRTGWMSDQLFSDMWE